MAKTSKNPTIKRIHLVIGKNTFEEWVELKGDKTWEQFIEESIENANKTKKDTRTDT